MAKMTTIGIEDFDEKLSKIQIAMKSEVMAEMLQAGAAVMVDSWKNTIAEKGHIRTGEMQRNVEAGEVKLNDDGTATIDVYPRGTDRQHKISNAAKAYVLHHGRKAKRNGRGALKGDRFVTKAEKAGREQVSEAMQAVLDEYLTQEDT